jgi:hypothetical protein
MFWNFSAFGCNKKYINSYEQRAALHCIQKERNTLFRNRDIQTERLHLRNGNAVVMLVVLEIIKVRTNKFVTIF